MSTPRVSVVIPTRDRAPLLAQAIDSVLGQSFRDHEVIVCDDGSTDNTAARVESFGSPVRYLRLEASGRPGAPRNRGIEAARGELIAFLDDDDLWEPEKLARQVEVMDREPAVGIVYTDRLVLYPDGSRSGPVLTDRQKSPDDLLELVLDGLFPSICTALVRREALDRAGGFDESLVTAEDMDLWLRLARLTRAACIPEPLTLIRRRAGSLSDQSGPLTFRNAIDVLRRQLRAGDLTLSQRMRCRRTVSRMYAGLAAKLKAEGNPAGARSAALRAIRHFPASRLAWTRAAGVWLARD